MPRYLSVVYFTDSRWFGWTKPSAKSAGLFSNRPLRGRPEL